MFTVLFFEENYKESSRTTRTLKSVIAGSFGSAAIPDLLMNTHRASRDELSFGQRRIRDAFEDPFEDPASFEKNSAAAVRPC
ncbi:hypothetical protein NDN08_004813 [Rhodosorus marinus]|uniref:Uncharacterized protein n=1 Tax=Rhodosorus marinus TaxID=101924 RepID=A0AAV8URK3_9RHOD|nr:hypothetical protein NDN08_004813 [Rhodosorus marinus]